VSPRRLVVLTFVFVMVAHTHVHLGYLRGLNTLRVPAAPPAAPKPAVEARLIGAPKRAPLAPIPKADRVRHAVVVVLDGLGFEQAMAAPALAAIADAGASRMMRAEFPTFTYPGMTSMMTGRPPLYSGVRINGPRPTLPWDSLPRRAAAAGYVVRFDPELFLNFESLLLLPDGAERIDSTNGFPPASAPHTLDLVYEGRIDRAAHHHGTLGAEYRDVVTLAAERTAAIWGSLDPQQDLLMVVSEHGHRESGGHGGAEPEAARALLIAAGKGVPAGAKLRSGWMRDLSPTIAALLGADAPKDSLGLPMRDVLGLSGDVAREYDRQAAADDAIFQRQAAIRMMVVGFLMILAMAVHPRRWRPDLELRDFLPLVIYPPIVAVGHAALGLTISWSIPASQILYQLATMVIGLGAAAIAVALVGRRERATNELIATLFLAIPAYVLASAWIGFSQERMAGPLASFGFLLTVTVVFYASIAFAIRSLWVGRKPASTIRRVAVWGGGLVVALAVYAVPVLGRFYLPR